MCPRCLVLLSELVGVAVDVVGQLDDACVAVGDGVQVLAHGVVVYVWFLVVDVGDV